MNCNLKVACAATLMALGVSAQASSLTSKTQITTAESDNGMQRVIVKYKAGHAKTAKSMALKAGGNVKVELKRQNALAIEVSEKALEGLRNNPNVESVEVDVKRYPAAIYNDDIGDPSAIQLNPYAIYQSQADQLTLGSGVQKVCVMDSGIAGGEGEMGGKHNDFDWSTITGTSDSGTGDWFTDGGPHGTHVAGTIGAADNGIGVVGMAPGVPMHIIKVFNADGYGYSSNIAAAAEACVDAGATIINMSLKGNFPSSLEEEVFDNFTANGGLAIAAAGNDENDSRSYPAGYESVLTVGANDANNEHASFSQFPSCNDTEKRDCVEVTAGGVNTLSTYPAGSGSLPSLTADTTAVAATAMENQGSASGDTYFMGTAESTDSAANGKICLIDRGNINFVVKAANCEDSGGIGAVIINNEPGAFNGTLGDSNTTTIPVVAAAQEDRDTLLEASTVSIAVEPSDYGYMSGTSMATPAVSGIAALVWSNHPTCTGTEIREALKATAEDAGAPGHDVYFGHGIVKAKAASDYITANGCAGSSNPVNEAPVADFSYSCTALSCDFDASASTDDSGVVSYSWSFGSTGVTASNTFASEGTYSVTLTVADAEGLESSVTQSVSVSDSTQEPSDISLEASRFWFGYYTSLNWSGAQGTAVDVYRNGVFIGSTANDGYDYVTELNINEFHVYKVCETGSTTSCSDISISWAY